MLFVACEDEEEPFYTGVAIYVSDTDYYILDAGVSGSVEASLDNREYEVSVDGVVIAELTADGAVANYTFTQADFNYMETGESQEVKFLTQGKGGPSAKYINFKVEDPLTVDGPSDFYPAEDTTLYIKYSIADDCTAPTSLVITEQRNSEDPVTLAGPFDLLEDSIAVALTNAMLNDTLVYTWTFSNDNGVLETTHILYVIVKRAWDFEEYDSWATEFAPWTLVDNDGNSNYTVSAFDYPGAGSPASFMIFDYQYILDNDGDPTGWEPNSGDKYAFCMAAVPDATGNDDWMISDNFDIEDGYELSLYARSRTDSYGLERLVVKVIDNADDSETVLTPDPYQEVPTDWTNFTFDLSAFAGKNIKVSIGCVSYDAFAMYIDDFEILTGEGKSVFKNGFENARPTVKTVPVKLK
ncbi:MAG: hypothetical protein C0599_00995 [Salinivirgaceae bacterium]|nr:MAG: hypothetical protein C0599_00995 [Salinivirgaceae bacterium]